MASERSSQPAGDEGGVGAPPGMFAPGMFPRAMFPPGCGGMPGYPGMGGMMPPGMMGYMGANMGANMGAPVATTKSKKEKKHKEGGKEKKDKEKEKEKDKGKDKRRKRERSRNSDSSGRQSGRSEKKKKKKRKGKEKNKKNRRKTSRSVNRSVSRSAEAGATKDAAGPGRLGDDVRAAAARAAVAGAIAGVAAAAAQRGKVGKSSRIAAGRSQSQDSSGSGSGENPKRSKTPSSSSASGDSDNRLGIPFDPRHGMPGVPGMPGMQQQEFMAAAAGGFMHPSFAGPPGFGAPPGTFVPGPVAGGVLPGYGHGHGHPLKAGAPTSVFSDAPSAAAAPNQAPTAASSGWDGVEGPPFRKLDKLDVLPIPRDIIGRVIGKGGCVIKDIRDRSGARVDARDQTEDPVQVLISGTEEAVEAAKILLLKAAEGPGRHLVVDDALARAKAQAQAAAAAISASKPDGGSPDAPPVATGPTIEGVIDLPKQNTGKLIGTRGAQIAEIRAKSGAQVDVDKSETACRVRIVGTHEQVEQAKVLITQIVQPLASEGGGEYLEIPKQSVGRIIGAGGARIQELQDRSGAKIDIDRTNPERILVRFAGLTDHVATAKQMVADVLEGRDRSVGGEAQLCIDIPSTCTGRLIGPSGKQINAIQETSGAKVDVDKSREPCIVRIVGGKESVAIAEAMVRDVIATMPPAALLGRPLPLGMTMPPPAGINPVPPAAGTLGLSAAALDEETIRFDIELNVLEKLLSSQNGGWARSVTAKTGARVQVKRDAAGKCFLELSGQPEQCIDAESMCEDAVRLISTAAVADAADVVAAGGSNKVINVPTPPAPPGSQAPGALTLKRPPLLTPMPPRPPAVQDPRLTNASWNNATRPKNPSPDAPGAISLGLRPSLTNTAHGAAASKASMKQAASTPEIAPVVAPAVPVLSMPATSPPATAVAASVPAPPATAVAASVSGAVPFLMPFGAPSSPPWAQPQPPAPPPSMMMAAAMGPVFMPPGVQPPPPMFPPPPF